MMLCVDRRYLLIIVKLKSGKKKEANFNHTEQPIQLHQLRKQAVS